MPDQVIRIHNTDIEAIEHAAQRVITLDQIDQVHERPKGTARRTFNKQKRRLVENRDYFVRTAYEANLLGITAPNGLILLSQRGYLLLVKTFRDDYAWDVQMELIEGYFRDLAKRATTAKPEIKDPTLKLLVDTIYRLDDVQEQVKVVQVEAAQAQEKADLAIRGQTWMTIRQYVAIHGLTRQLPPGKHQQQYGKYLTGYCMDKGLPVYKQVSVEGWNENTYPVWSIEETLSDWLRGRTRQLPMPKRT